MASFQCGTGMFLSPKYEGRGNPSNTTSVPISVRLWGLDRDGKVFSQNAKTLNIATSGARLYGVTAALERGFIVGLQCGNMRARFMVVWVGEKGSSREGQIGLRAAENGIWSVALPRASDEDFSTWLSETYLENENSA